MRLISEDEFFVRLRSVSKARPDGRIESFEWIQESIERCWNNSAKANNLSEVHNCPGVVLFGEPNEERNYNCYNFDNWVWDRPTGLFIININRGYHERLLGDLYLLHTGLTHSVADRDDAGSYIREGFGFALSSIAQYPIKGLKTELTDHEHIIFENMDFRGL
jgi:hypothetical protein